MKKLVLLIMLAFPLIVNAESFKNTDEALSSVVKKAIVTMEKTGDFVIEQAPMVLQEFYQWHIISSILLIMLSVVIFLIGRYASYLWLSKEKSCWRFFKRYGEEYSDTIILAWVTFCISIIIAFVIFSLHLYKLIFILVAPKLYLLEYFVK